MNKVNNVITVFSDDMYDFGARKIVDIIKQKCGDTCLPVSIHTGIEPNTLKLFKRMPEFSVIGKVRTDVGLMDMFSIAVRDLCSDTIRRIAFGCQTLYIGDCAYLVMSYSYLPIDVYSRFRNDFEIQHYTFANDCMYTYKEAFAKLKQFMFVCFRSN